MKALLFVFLILFISCSDSSTSSNISEPKLVIASVVSSPSINESIEILNQSDNVMDISRYLLMDRSAGVFKVSDSTTIEAKESIIFTRESHFNFSVNDTNEVIYLLDREINKLDSWSN
jgi:hypothetical protein